MSHETIAEAFQLLDSWEDRYGYVIDLGRRLPPFPDQYKTDRNLVKGCTSQVWFVAGDQKNVITFQADSDALIVRGLIAVLGAVYHGRDAAFVRGFDIDGYFAQLGLAEHLSPNRRSGFFAIVGRIKALAAQ